LACHSARSASLVRTFTQTARPGLTSRRFRFGGQRGHGPPPASPGDTRSVATESMLALRPIGRPTTPSAACPCTVVGRRQRGGRPPPGAVRRTRSPGLAKRGRRRDGSPLCRAVHVPAKPERRPIPASAPVGGHGHQLRHGMDQPELRVSSCISPRWVVLPFHPSVTRRATSYGCHPQLVSSWLSRLRRQVRVADARNPAVRIAIPTSQRTDSGGVNYAGIGDVPRAPAMSRRLN